MGAKVLSIASLRLIMANKRSWTEGAIVVLVLLMVVDSYYIYDLRMKVKVLEEEPQYPAILEMQSQALLQMQTDNEKVYDTIEGWVKDTTDRLVEVEQYAYYNWDASDEIYWEMESFSRTIYNSLKSHSRLYSELNLELQRLSTIVDVDNCTTGENFTSTVDIPCLNTTTGWFEVYVYDENCTKVTSLYFPREWLEAIVQDVISKYWGSLGSRYDRRLPEE